MSSTILTNTRVGAFPGDNGKNYYVLFTETYESNIEPKTPRWSCSHIGELESTINAIFNIASNAEGGMIKRPRSYTTPESLIREFFVGLTSPMYMGNYQIDVEVGGHYSCHVSGSNAAMFEEMLQRHGRDIGIPTKVSIFLWSDAELIINMIEQGISSSFRLIPGHLAETGTEEATLLAYKPTLSKVKEVVTPRFLRLNRDDYLAQRDDGTWRLGGSSSDIMGGYIRADWQHELINPGNYRQRIGAYRESIAAAPFAPAGLKVLISCQPEGETDSICKMLKDVDYDGSYYETPTGVIIEYKSHNTQLYWKLRFMQDEAATWLVDESHLTAAKSQMDLFSA